MALASWLAVPSVARRDGAILDKKGRCVPEHEQRAAIECRDGQEPFLERLAFQAKDGLFTIDDFKPGSTAEVDRLHAQADRIFRSQGNGSGRCAADGTARCCRPPQG